MFVALGLAIVGPSDVWDDLPEGLALAFVVASSPGRSTVFLLLPRARLRTREKLFIAWGGLKGAVPILLAAIALVSGTEDSLAIYNIVFIVVLVSVLVQGSTIPYAARRLGIPMRIVEPEPFGVSIGLREPGQVQHYTVGPARGSSGARSRTCRSASARGSPSSSSTARRVQRRGSHVFRVGDEVHILGDPEDAHVLRRLFEGPARGLVDEQV